MRLPVGSWPAGRAAPLDESNAIDGTQGIVDRGQWPAAIDGPLGNSPVAPV